MGSTSRNQSSRNTHATPCTVSQKSWTPFSAPTPTTTCCPKTNSPFGSRTTTTIHNNTNTTTTPSPSDDEDLVVVDQPWTEELKILEGMGFTDKEQLKLLLNENKTADPERVLLATIAALLK